jgi:hypothetical protein
MLNKIRDDYGCSGEIIFRTALQIVVEAGQCTVLDDTWYQCELEDINARHSESSANGMIRFISEDLEKTILECAREIAKIKPYDLLMYVQKEVWLSGDGIDYKRAIELLKECIDWFTDDESYKVIENLNLLGFTNDEIEELGYGWLFEREEE